MYYIGLDVHKKTISYCVKDAAGQVHREGKIGSTRRAAANGKLTAVPGSPFDFNISLSGANGHYLFGFCRTVRPSSRFRWLQTAR
jgi:hypothetical protein